MSVMICDGAVGWVLWRRGIRFVVRMFRCKISNGNATLNGIEVFEAFRHHIAFFVCV